MPQPPPPPGPPPGAPPQHCSSAAGHMAAPATGIGDGSFVQQQQPQHQRAAYSAIPPPASLVQHSSATAASGRRTFTIRPQLPKPKATESASSLMLAFNQAAAKLNSSMAPAAAAPAYMRVQAGTANAPQQGAVAPQQWPPALKAYVERAFKACDLVSAAAWPMPRCCFPYATAVRSFTTHHPGYPIYICFFAAPAAQAAGRAEKCHWQCTGIRWAAGAREVAVSLATWQLLLYNTACQPLLQVNSGREPGRRCRCQTSLSVQLTLQQCLPRWQP